MTDTIRDAEDNEDAVGKDGFDFIGVMIDCDNSDDDEVIEVASADDGEERSEMQIERAYAACIAESRGCALIDRGATSGYVSGEAISHIQDDGVGVGRAR